MWWTFAVVVSVAFSCWLWVRAWHTPPPVDGGAQRRLQQELRRHHQNDDT